jgi:O-antigen ligase
MSLWDKAALAVLGGVLAYVAFEWAGVARTGRYEYLLALGLLAMVLSLGRSRDEWAPLPGGVVRWTLALLPAYVLVQVVPLPVSLVRVLSPARAEGVAALNPIGAKVNFASLSVSPAATFQSFLLLCGYLIIFLLVRELAWRFGVPPVPHAGPAPASLSRSGGFTPPFSGWRGKPAATFESDTRSLRCEGSCWLAIWPIVAIGALEAGLGLIQCFGGAGEQARRGTYANRDHYVGFLEMALPFAVVYPVALWRRARSRWHSPLAPALAACGVWALAGLMLAGIVFSFSRMGFVATLFSLFVMGTLAFGTRQLSWVASSRKRQGGAVGLVAALALAGFVFLPPDKLILRFAQLVSTDELTAGTRAHLWAETIPLIGAYPFFGCGLGGYETAFWRFNVSEPLLTDDFAHNDYLQLLAELGLVGFAIGATLAFSVVRTAVRRAVISADPGARYFAVACAGALAAILLHSLVDFNLYIPANAMLLAWIAGMTAGVGIADFRLTIDDCRWTLEGVATPLFQSAIGN